MTTIVNHSELAWIMSLVHGEHEVYRYIPSMLRLNLNLNVLANVPKLIYSVFLDFWWHFQK